MIVTEIKNDESIFQDYILDDEAVTTIESGYEAWAEVYEGMKLLHNVQLALNIDQTGYELRIGKTTTNNIFQDGHTYVLQVYEKNEVLSYKNYIHEEKFKVRF